MKEELTYYKLRSDQELTDEQIAEIEAASKRPIVYDDDCPRIDPEDTPERYQALLKAVEDRNRRIALIIRSTL